MWAIITTLIIAGVVLGIALMFREICPALFPKHNKKFKRDLLIYIEWKRNRDMEDYKNLYPNESAWNEECLSDAIYEFKMSPRYHMKDMKRSLGEDYLSIWVNQNDRSVLQSRIDELERENRVGKYDPGT